MARRSNKSIAEILAPAINAPLLYGNDNNDKYITLERKITLATEGFTTHKFCELVLKDRSRLSDERVYASLYGLALFEGRCFSRLTDVYSHRTKD